VRLMRSGAGDFVTKPFSMEEFLDRIETGRRRRSAIPRSGYMLGESPAMHRT
jgi:two-component system, NtrC family, response regulator HydG